MRSSFIRRFVPLLAAVPLAFIPAAASAGGTPTGTPMHTRITNHQILGTISTPGATPATPAAPADLPSKQEQIKVLTAALNTMQANYSPGHPVHLSVDGRAVATLTATPLGTVTGMIDPATLNLPAGTHQVELSSLLITQTASLRTR